MKFREWQALTQEQQKAYFEAYKKAATCSNKQPPHSKNLTTTKSPLAYLHYILKCRKCKGEINMNEIEKMQRYINKTEVDVENRYTLLYGEIVEMVHLSQEDPFEAIHIAFNYGKAKGCRAARKEVQR